MSLLGAMTHGGSQPEAGPPMSEVFVSYGHPDDTMGWVQRFSADLRKHLEALTREPPKVFSDHGLNPLEPWRKIIEEAAETARVLVVISSPNFLSSKWCERECEIYWRQASSEAMARGRIAVVELRPISDEEIERLVAQRKGNSSFIDPRDLRQILKNFTPIHFYKNNSSGIPMPLALVLSEVDARNTPDYAEYAEKVYTLAFFINEAVDKLRRRDEETTQGEKDDDDDITLEDLDRSNTANLHSESIFIDCGPSCRTGLDHELLSGLKRDPAVHLSADFDSRDYDRLRTERFAEDAILVAVYRPGEDEWLRETVEVVCRALKLRKELRQPPARKLLIAGELTPETRTAVLRQLRPLIAFVDVEVIGLERAIAILSTRVVAGGA